MRDINHIILSGAVKPGTIIRGETKKGDKEIVYMAFILQVRSHRKYQEFIKCKLFGERVLFYEDKIRDNSYLMVTGRYEIQNWKGRFYPNVLADQIYILQGFEHEYWESGEEGVEVEIPMQLAGEEDVQNTQES